MDIDDKSDVNEVGLSGKAAAELSAGAAEAPETPAPGFIELAVLAPDIELESPPATVADDVPDDTSQGFLLGTDIVMIKRVFKSSQMVRG